MKSVSSRYSASPCVRRRSSKAKRLSFGDLCEMSGGLATVWRRNGCSEKEMLAFIHDDPFVLCDVVPAMHSLGFTEDDVLRYVPHDGPLAAIMLCLSRFVMSRGRRRYGSEILALPPCVLVAFLRRMVTKRIAAMKNKVSRNVHYVAEKIRRRAMAAERRRIKRRTTTNSCPTKEMVLDAWRHVRDSKETLIRFGSLMQDLECYVDNSLRFDRAGHIVGRNAGVKGWLMENLPELAEHYTSVIRYKAAAKKLRQIVGLADPTPVAAVLGGTETNGTKEPCALQEFAHEEENQCNCSAEKIYNADYEGAKLEGVDIGEDESPPVEVVRARAVYLEAMEGVPDVAARVLARIDVLCDPERTDDASMLRSWREKYACAITVRRKTAWWKRLTA